MNIVTTDFDIHPDMDDLVRIKLELPDVSPTDLRGGWSDYGKRLARPYPKGMVVGDTYLSVPGAGIQDRVPVRFYRAANLKEPSPCVIYLHGGGFVMGSRDSADTIAWGIADHLGCICVSVEYRLAPEHPFPAGLDDCYGVLSHLAEHGAAYGIDGQRIAMWGDSAGANLTTAVCLMARDKGGPKVVAQALVYGCLTDDLSAESYRKYGKAFVTTDFVNRCWTDYLGSKRPSRDGYATPLNAKDLSGLPPAMVHYAEIDCQADDSIRYAARLKEAGNDVTMRCAKGMIHGFTRCRFSGPTAAAEYAATCDFLKKRLQ